MSDRPARLVLFARAPALGKVKTRLQPDLSPEESLALHRALVRDALALIRRVARRGEVEPEVAYSEPLNARDPLAGEAEGIERTTQRGDDLGERLVRKFQERLHPPVRRVVVIGSDCPTLTPEYVQGAFEALQDAEVVLGPAADGGYVLVGCTKLHVRPFQRIPWGTGQVLAETRRRLKREKIRHTLLRTEHDLDTVDDLLRSYRELEHLRQVGAQARAPHTLAAMREILHARPELYARMRAGDG